MVNKDWKNMVINQCKKDGAKEPRYNGIPILNVNKIVRDNKINFICECGIESDGKTARQIEKTGAYCKDCTNKNKETKCGRIKWSKEELIKYFSSIIFLYNINLIKYTKKSIKENWDIPNYTWFKKYHPNWVGSLSNYGLKFQDLKEIYGLRDRRNKNKSEEDIIKELREIYTEKGMVGLTMGNLDKEGLSLGRFISKFQTDDDKKNNMPKGGTPPYPNLYACRVLNILEERKIYLKHHFPRECDSFEEIVKIHIEETGLNKIIMSKYGDVWPGNALIVLKKNSIWNAIKKRGKNMDDIRKYFGLLSKKPRGFDDERYESFAEVYFYNSLFLRNIEYKDKIKYTDIPEFSEWWMNDCPKELRDKYKKIRPKNKIPKFKTDGKFWSPVLNEFIYVEIWGRNYENINENDEMYLLTRKIKELFWKSMNKYKFLGIEWNDCGNEEKLLGILFPYIGICIPKYCEYDYRTDVDRLQELKLELEENCKENNGVLNLDKELYNKARVIFGRNDGQIISKCKKLIGIIDELYERPNNKIEIDEKISLFKKAMEIENTNICNFNQNYIVPKNDIHPELEGEKIGQHQAVVRSRFGWLNDNEDYNKEIIQKLIDINFVWDTNEYEFLKIYYSLILYMRKFKTLSVPQKFEFNIKDFKNELEELNIPEKYISKVPFLLGGSLNNIRNRNNYINEEVTNQNLLNLEKYGIKFTNKEERKKMLDDIGFIWDTKKYEFDKIIKSLNLYKEIHNNLEVPKKCEINNKYFTKKQLNKLENIEPLYIKKTDIKDLKIGNKVNGIRSKKQYIKDDTRKNQLKDMGFRF